jgi:hypothetical protein
MTKPESPNTPCPYCHRACRWGMTHECEAAPEGFHSVQMSRDRSGFTITLYGSSE